jgi:hypothetical protein
VRPNLDIEVRANSGDISISLPHGFRGEITIRASSDRIKFSPTLGACTSLLLDIPEERVFFVHEGGTKWRNGNGKDRAQSRQEESEDALLVYGEYSSVRINWTGEEDLRLPGTRIVVPKLGPGWKAFLNDVGKLVLPSRKS